MNWAEISQQIRQPSRRWDLILVTIAALSISTEVFFQANGGNTLDWNDWLFWAKQNYGQMIASGDPFSLVISPVQGLFGLSYPLNPFFNPLWLIAVLINDSILAHQTTTVIVFVLLAAITTLLLSSQVKNPWFRLLIVFLILNMFFDNFLPLSSLIAYPETTFSYFRLMPPQNILLIEALMVFYFATRKSSKTSNVLIVTVVSMIALISDPFYFFLYFTPVILVLAIYYLINITTRWKECLVYILIGMVLFVTGPFEFPFLLKDSIARSVFNESLFHSIKAIKISSFTFQFPQNIAYSLLLSIGLGYLWFKKKDTLALSILCVELVFVLAGAVYLSGNTNFNFMPPLHAFESSMIVLYFVFGARGIEVFFSESRALVHFRRLGGPLMLVVSLGFVALKVGASFSADSRARDVVEPYSNSSLVMTREHAEEVQSGSISFALGTQDSEFNEKNSLPERFGLENRSFTQNNEGESFYDKYGRTTSLISYWLKGQSTLEENNHMTNPFYVYFFRKLFMQPDDYYGTNLNIFTRPRKHLYRMLGVEYLFSDDEALSNQVTELVLNEERFFLHRNSDFNSGQFSPAEIQYVSDAEQAIGSLDDVSFDPTRTALIHMQEKHLISQYQLTPAQYGHITYENNRVIFEGDSEGTSLNILPVLFSNCLTSGDGYRLVRANLILTGIIFEGAMSTKLSFEGPPFNNSCLSKDIEEIETFGLKNETFPYPNHYDRTKVYLLREYVVGVIAAAGLYNSMKSLGWDIENWETRPN